MSGTLSRPFPHGGAFFLASVLSFVRVRRETGKSGNWIANSQLFLLNSNAQ
jgi:hypothetical protein